MSRVTSKSVFGVSDQIRHEPDCTDTEDGYQGLKVRILRENNDCTIYVAKSKALIGCAVTTQLISAFVFAFAKRRFSHDVAQKYISVNQLLTLI